MTVRPLAVLVASLALVGCGATTDSDAPEFQGAQAEVAEKVEELQSAGEGRAPEDICSEILARELVDSLEAGGTTCASEMEAAIDDADDFDLVVREVTVEGDTATARVQRGDEGPIATFEFVREENEWRASSLSS